MIKIKLIIVSIIAIMALQSCNNDKKVVAIVNLQRHPILDAVQDNIISTLKDSGFEDKKNIRLIIKNANGQTNLIPSISNEVLSEKPDLVITISTPITQQFVKNAKCPVVFGAVTDPVGSGIVSSLDKPVTNITGTADVLPYEEQIKLIRLIHPQAKRLGVIYNPAEGPSMFAMKHIEIYAPKYGFELIKKTVSKTTEIQQAAQAIVDECDVILVSSDNTVTGGVSAIVNIAIKNKKPLYAGDEGSIMKGAIASYSINYDELGKETGNLCVRMLKGERNLPVFVSTKGDLVINLKAAELMGVALPDSLVNKAVKKIQYDRIMHIVNIIDTGLIMGLLLTSIVASLGISFRLLNFPDLTIDGSFALGAAISATMLRNDYPLVFAVFVSIFCGGLAGVATALLHTKLRINKFLSGIIVVTALYSVLIRIMKGGNISFGQRTTFFDFAGKYDSLNAFSFGTVLLLLILSAFILFVAYVFLKSSYGIRLRAACLNTDLAKSIGLNSSRALIIGLFFTNTLAAFSGTLFSLKSSYADIGYMQGMLIVSLASLTIGEKIVPVKSLNKLTYVLLASVFGSIVYQIIWAAALKFNIEPTDLNLITALIVVGLFFWKRNNKNASIELQ